MSPKFPRINFQSKGLERTISSAFLLIPSIGCSTAGLWLSYESVVSGNRELGRLGFFLFIGGMTIVPLGLTVLGNRLFRVERERLRLKPTQRAVQAKVRRLEKQLKYGYLIKRHPIIVPFFCFCALAGSIGMALAPEWVPKKDHQSTALEIMGIICGRHILWHWCSIFLLPQRKGGSLIWTPRSERWKCA